MGQTSLFDYAYLGYGKSGRVYTQHSDYALREVVEDICGTGDIEKRSKWRPPNLIFSAAGSKRVVFFGLDTIAEKFWFRPGWFGASPISSENQCRRRSLAIRLERPSVWLKGSGIVGTSSTGFREGGHVIH